MGYSATLIDVRCDNPDGDPMRLSGERLPEVMRQLRHEEGRNGHISWCEAIDEYESRSPDDLAETIEAILNDYGWTADADGSDVVLSWWQGDKLGMSWDGVRDAIAAGLDPELTVTWIMSGEDAEMWAEQLHAGKAATHAVRVEID